MAGLGFSNSEFAQMLNVSVEVVHEEVLDDLKPVETSSMEAPANVPVPEVKPMLPLPDMKKMGTWQKHTKGFGMKMLAKMGFKGRLGKDEQGVAAPVAVKARPNQMGLGFGDFKEAVTLKQNKEIERELHGKVEGDDVEADDSMGQPPDDGAWRKRIPGASIPTSSRKRKRKTIDDVLEEEKSAIDLVVDMRGPVAQVYTDGMGSVSSSSTTMPTTTPLLGQEILHNVRHIVNQTEGSIRALHAKISMDRARIQALRAAHAVDAGTLRQNQVAANNVASLVSGLQTLQSTLQNEFHGNIWAIQAIVSTTVTLRTSFPTEFEAHRVIDVVPSLGLPLLQAMTSSWHPLRVDASAMDLRGGFRMLQECLVTCVAPLEDTSERGVFAINVDSTTRHDQIYDHLVRQALLPKLVSALHRWDVQTAPPCLALIEFLRGFVPAVMVESILTNHVLPRLQHAVRHCDRVADVECIHDWLLPWREHFDATLFAADLYPVIRETLARTLIKWHPNDSSVFAVLLPWREVWTPEDFALFTHKHIVKKLVRVLNREFHINPKAQDLEPLEWVLAWHRVLPDRQFVALLEAEFFTKWLKVLAEWVAQNPLNVAAEMLTWYSGWKALFDEFDLLQEERICMQFHGALQLMQCVQQAATLPGLKLLPPTYEDALLRGKKRAAPVHPKHDLHGTVNMRDVVEEFAMQHNIEFAPTKHKSVDGRQVYAFGRQHIVIDHSLLFIESTKGQFDPIDIDELVKKA
ncbi:hypothetical protein H257_03510 [Aphanomyces astaci]|uniref:G-patch domain-containing protein n=1 Tax=Aphanomyces astaci TaxID=112090 RepID=W4GY39_APHAT|nr:hypothetical protein H257_03510 [Aphanomyces astaci]ETV84251.1 hypothetical protein H257_03510 [Aphanomyces astaci]RQM24706.1 hypothetical protein B5M09_002179 [Aphanomyces astaci]|eukprot:XP_009825943.1 hypothetical protein H257_03510 [Aphanomyces astaci]